MYPEATTLNAKEIISVTNWSPSAHLFPMETRKESKPLAIYPIMSCLLEISTRNYNLSAAPRKTHLVLCSKIFKNN